MCYGIVKILCFLCVSALVVCPATLAGKDNTVNTPRQAFTDSSDYSTIWEALINFDLAAALAFNPNQEESGVITAMQLIDQCQYPEAEKTLIEIYNTTKNSFLKKKCGRILVDLMFFRSGWNDISEFDAQSGGKYRYKDDSMLLVDALSVVPKEEYSFYSDSSGSELQFSPTGSPMIEVVINGHRRHFWLDTGANYSVLSSETAKDCEVKILSQETSRALTPTITTIKVRPALIDSIIIAGLKVKNHPAVVVEEIDLKFKFFGTNKITRIDGIIGWKLIQNLDLTIDYANSIAIIKKPFVKVNQKRNFFWIGCPIVRLFTADSTVLNFGLDTGAENSSITDNIFRKVAADKIYNVTKTMGTLGGWVYNDSYIIPELELTMDTTLVKFSNLGTAYQLKTYFMKLDGFLGSNTFRNSKIRIDWLNGRFDYFPLKAN